jgi:hypothetical protein
MYGSYYGCRGGYYGAWGGCGYGTETGKPGKGQLDNT